MRRNSLLSALLISLFILLGSSSSSAVEKKQSRQEKLNCEWQLLNLDEKIERIHQVYYNEGWLPPSADEFYSLIVQATRRIYETTWRSRYRTDHSDYTQLLEWLTSWKLEQKLGPNFPGQLMTQLRAKTSSRKARIRDSEQPWPISPVSDNGRLMAQLREDIKKMGLSPFLQILNRFRSYDSTDTDLYIDELLGLETVNNFYHERYVLNQREFDDETGTWQGLLPGVLNTPYSSFFQILKMLKMKPGETIVDLGAGAGRMGLVVGAQWPKVNYLGYEFHKRRMAGAKKLSEQFGYANVHYKQVDFARPNFSLADADVYFIWWSNRNEDVMNTLMHKLQEVARRRPIRIVSMGSTMGTEEVGWLQEVSRVKNGEDPHDSLGLIYRPQKHLGYK